VIRAHLLRTDGIVRDDGVLGTSGSGRRARRRFRGSERGRRRRDVDIVQVTLRRRLGWVVPPADPLAIDNELVQDLGVPRDPDRGLKVRRCLGEAQRLGPLLGSEYERVWSAEEGRTLSKDPVTTTVRAAVEGLEKVSLGQRTTDTRTRRA